MPFPYNNNVPLPIQTFAATQSPILNNFKAIDELITVDHFTFGTANYGKHQWMHLPRAAAAPAFIADEDVLYTLRYPTTDKSELYVHKQRFGAGATAEIPLTASILSTAAPIPNLGGWTYLPSGILMKWKLRAVNSTGATSVDFSSIPAYGPHFTQVFSVFVTPMSTDGLLQCSQYSAFNIPAQTFNIYSNGGTYAGSVNCLVIGV